MLEYFASWPIDGLTVFIALGISIPIIIGSSIMQASSVKPNNNNTFILKPGLKAYIFTAAMLILACAFFYAGSQASDDQKFWAILVVSALSVGVLRAICKILQYTYSFNQSTLTRTNVLGKTENFDWNKCISMETSQNGIEISFKGQTISINDDLNGSEQLLNFLCLKFLGLKNFNHNVAIGPRFLDEMNDKKIVIGITYLNKNYEVQNLAQVHGTIKNIEKNRLTVELDGMYAGQKIELPTNMDAITPAEETGITLTSTGEHITKLDYFSEWYTQDIQWKD